LTDITPSSTFTLTPEGITIGILPMRDIINLK
jgi:hypothetical protein